MLVEGDIVEIKNGHKVYADVPEHFVYANRKGVFNMTHSAVTVGGELSYLAGKYVVTKAFMDGGGSSGLEANGSGYHVFCESISGPVRKIDFYQSGSFTAMIPELEPIGRAEIHWKV